MTMIYPTYWPLRCISRLLFLTSFICAINVSQAQTYYVTLSGLSEVPPNNSAGTGKALITINGNLMRVQANFSGLTGNTTASHIHAATAVAGVGTAGVATTTPTFTGFPTGVNAGTYDHTFDMTLSTSYNPSYVTANGATTASAFIALKAAIAAGKSYLNVHSTIAPGGEIRGFLIACPTITVSIPDAWALSSGTLANTVYPAYAPASSLTIQASASGGAASYSYNWSNTATTSSITVSPTVTTVYSVTATDQNGCTGTASKTVNVMDISGGKNGDKIVVCHKGNSLTIGVTGVADHLGHNDMLGACSGQESIAARSIVGEELRNDALSVKVLSNPSPDYFELKINGKADNSIQLKVYDLQGRVVETRSSLNSNQIVRLGMSYRPGVFVVQIVQGAEMKIVKLVKAN